MKKLLITNNCSVIKKNFDEIYTDSPSVIEYCNNAKYLDSFLDPEHQNKIIEIKKKGLQLNKKIVKLFFILSLPLSPIIDKISLLFKISTIFL